MAKLSNTEIVKTTKVQKKKKKKKKKKRAVVYMILGVFIVNFEHFSPFLL